MQQLTEFIANNIVLVSAFFIILFLLLRTFFVSAGAKSVTAMEAVRLINHNNALVLDVRTQEEFAKSHILNAVNIPMGLLSSRISEIQDRKTDPIILVCQSGNRSLQSARTLKKNTFDQLYNLSGGMLSWQQANLPIESISKSKSPKNKKAQKKTHNISSSNQAASNESEQNVIGLEHPDQEKKIIVYTTSYCPYSGRVTRLLKKKGVNFQQVNVDNSPDIKQAVNNKSQQTTFPQVFRGETHIGNCDELYQLDRDGKLDDILGLKHT
ncbi:rhodanese-like domain-containing protein [Kaarinaea lacus]